MKEDICAEFVRRINARLPMIPSRYDRLIYDWHMTCVVNSRVLQFSLTVIS